jgi:recombination protein RecT
MSAENQDNPKALTIMQKQEKVKENVMTFIKDTESGNANIFPKNYHPTAALYSAWLFLKEAVDKDNQPVLSVCSPASVQQSLLKMLTNGLSVTKNQCYFVAYGGKLECPISYHGKELIAKRSGGVAKVIAQAIYETDEFAFEVDNETGIKKVTKHTQTLESIGDGTKIKGAYCIVDFEDGRRETTIMTKAQIFQAWNQRKGNGLTPAHTKFTDEMACKTVRNRALKHAINSSDDSAIFDDEENEVTPEVKSEPKSKANSEKFDFDEHEELESKVTNPEPAKAEEPKKSSNGVQVEAPFA